MSRESTNAAAASDGAGNAGGVAAGEMISHDAVAADSAPADVTPAGPAAPAPSPAAKSTDASNGARKVDTKSTISASRGFIDWLVMNRVSLAFTSYQTGQLFLAGVMPDRRLSIYQRNFTRAMGLWGNADRIYLASIAQIWRLENMLQPNQRANKNFDRMYVPRNAHTTGDLDIHEVGIDKRGRPIFVNTKFSCLAMTSPTASFKPIWKPPFISRLAAEDRCHLNGLAMAAGRPAYVTAVSRSDVVNGWRERRHEGGVLIDVETDMIVTDQLSMPHSPRLLDGKVWLLDSGRGFLVKVDPNTGARTDIAFCPGFLRGLALHNGFAVATLSLPRDGNFSGLELDANLKARDGEAWCGVVVIDTRSGDIVQWLRIEGWIKELFDVCVLPRVRCPAAMAIDGPDIQHTISFSPTIEPLQ